MANNLGIPEELEKEVRQRDKRCVYCHIKMKQRCPASGPRKKVASLEHINNNGSSKDENNIVMCCTSCNSSKGKMKLSKWFKSGYCEKNKITEKTIKNSIVKRFINKNKGR